jgi:hypothetical protein
VSCSGQDKLRVTVCVTVQHVVTLLAPSRHVMRVAGTSTLGHRSGQTRKSFLPWVKLSAVMDTGVLDKRSASRTDRIVRPSGPLTTLGEFDGY